jgi:hypothetical protein
MRTQIDFEGELKLLDQDEGQPDEPSHKRWAKYLSQDPVPTHEDRPERRHAVHRRIASVGPALAAQRMESAAVSQAKKAPKWVLEESRTIG